MPGSGGHDGRAKASPAARALAVLALTGTVLAVLLVIGSSTSTRESPRDGRGARGADGTARSDGKADKPPRRYEVEPGDTLSEIADRFGVSESKLLELNPDLDPQALSTGQRLKLR